MLKLGKYRILFGLLLIGLAASLPAHADTRQTSRQQNIAGFPVITKAELPREGQVILDLIKQGGPFAYRKDGTVFQNRERRLPVKPKGYYHEYTVPTPGISGRGARRIVAGSNREFYYTDDHYRTFRLIKE